MIASTVSGLLFSYLNDYSSVFFILGYHVHWELLTLLSYGGSYGQSKRGIGQLQIITQDLSKLVRAQQCVCILYTHHY